MPARGLYDHIPGLSEESQEQAADDLAADEAGSEQGDIAEHAPHGIGDLVERHTAGLGQVNIVNLTHDSLLSACQEYASRQA